jgi:hypothetical protein
LRTEHVFGTVGTVVLTPLPRSLPRRDEAARARLAEVAGRVRPAVEAAQRVVPVAGPLGDALPGGGLRRASVVAIDGAPGSGATSVVLGLAAAATANGEWAAVVDLHGTFGGRAAAEAGVVLERFAVVRRTPPNRWATVVAALLDGFAFVAADVPARCRLGDARRLAARTRERAAMLVTLGPWPGEAAVRLHATASQWSGLERGNGLLRARDVQVRVEGRGAPVYARLRAG